MGKRFLIDTNIIIYFLKDEFPAASKKMVDKIFSSSFVISIVSQIEFLGHRGFSDAEYRDAEQFLSKARIINIDDRVIAKTIQLKRKQNIKTPDAIIAATSLVQDRTLVTRNVGDFVEIKSLEVFNPFEVTL